MLCSPACHPFLTPLDPNILPSSLFSNTLNLCSSLGVRWSKLREWIRVHTHTHTHTHTNTLPRKLQEVMSDFNLRGTWHESQPGYQGFLWVFSVPQGKLQDNTLKWDTSLNLLQHFPVNYTWSTSYLIHWQLNFADYMMM